MPRPIHALLVLAALACAPMVQAQTPAAKPNAAKPAEPQKPAAAAPQPSKPAPAAPAAAPQGKPATAPAPQAATPPPAPQGKPAATPPAAGAPAAAAPAAPVTPPETYVYRAEGRRDPFQPLVGTTEAKVASRRGEGPTGMSVDEITVRGVMESRGALVAMITGPDNKTYIVHAGDRLLDGTIKSITPQGLVVLQEVNDPLSLIKQREVRKLLRSLEDAKE